MILFKGLFSIKQPGYTNHFQHFENGFPEAVLVHNCWKSHFEPIAKTHQRCIPHLLRELTYLDECYDSAWPQLFEELLRDAVHLKQYHPIIAPLCMKGLNSSGVYWS